MAAEQEGPRGIEVAYVLLRAASKNAHLNEEGGSILHWAARWGNVATVTKVLDDGADVWCRDRRGKVAFQWAKEAGDSEVAVMIFMRNLQDLKLLDCQLLAQGEVESLAWDAICHFSGQVVDRLTVTDYVLRKRESVLKST